MLTLTLFPQAASPLLLEMPRDARPDNARPLSPTPDSTTQDPSCDARSIAVGPSYSAVVTEEGGLVWFLHPTPRILNPNPQIQPETLNHQPPNPKLSTNQYTLNPQPSNLTLKNPSPKPETPFPSTLIQVVFGSNTGGRLGVSETEFDAPTIQAISYGNRLSTEVPRS